MFKVNEAKAEAQKADDKVTSSTLLDKRGWEYLLDVCIVLLMGGILFWGAASQFYNQFNDATRYQCYAVAFWHGTPGLSSLPQKQCAFLSATTSSTLAQKMQERKFPRFLVNLVAVQSTSQPLHALPPEYPLLSLVPFSLALIVPAASHRSPCPRRAGSQKKTGRQGPPGEIQAPTPSGRSGAGRFALHGRSPCPRGGFRFTVCAQARPLGVPPS